MIPPFSALKYLISILLLLCLFLLGWYGIFREDCRPAAQLGATGWSAGVFSAQERCVQKSWWEL